MTVPPTKPMTDEELFDHFSIAQEGSEARAKLGAEVERRRLAAAQRVATAQETTAKATERAATAAKWAAIFAAVSSLIALALGLLSYLDPSS